MEGIEAVVEVVAEGDVKAMVVEGEDVFSNAVVAIEDAIEAVNLVSMTAVEKAAVLVELGNRRMVTSKSTETRKVSNT